MIAGLNENANEKGGVTQLTNAEDITLRISIHALCDHDADPPLGSEKMGWQSAESPIVYPSNVMRDFSDFCSESLSLCINYMTCFN